AIADGRKRAGPHSPGQRWPVHLQRQRDQYQASGSRAVDALLHRLPGKNGKGPAAAGRRITRLSRWALDLDNFSSTAAVAAVDFAAAVAAAFSSGHLSVYPADWAVAAAVVAAGPAAVAADPIAAYWGWSCQVVSAGPLQAVF